MAALNTHRRKEHQFIRRETTTKRQKQVDGRAHSVDGLPICKHCGSELTRWPQRLKHTGRQLYPSMQNVTYSHHNQVEEMTTLKTLQVARMLLKEGFYLQTCRSKICVGYHMLSLQRDSFNKGATCVQKWMAHPHFVKTHIRRSHEDYRQRHEHSAQLRAKQYAYVLGTSTRCALCMAKVQNKFAHGAAQCSSLYGRCCEIPYGRSQT